MSAAVRIWLGLALCLSCITASTALGDVQSPGYPRFLPPTEPASRDVVVVNWNGGDRLTDLAVRSLQGLVNRHTPSIWVGTDDNIGRSGWWLDRLVAFGLINSPTGTMSAFDFLQRYKGYANGIVIPPTDIGLDAYHVAVARAAVDDLMVGSDTLATTLGLPIIEDYRGRFASLAESFHHMFNSFIYTRRLNLSAFIYHRGDLGSSVNTIDYAIQQRLFTFTWHDGNYPEKWALEEILSFMPDNIPMLGAVGGGTGYASEGEVIQLISRYGKFSLGSSGADNVSFRTGIDPPAPAELTQNLRTPPTYDPNKVYVCVQMSDGDNTNAWRFHWLQNGVWAKRGQIPIGWSMGCGLYDALPTVTRYFYGNATELDEFFQGLSGLGYTWPGEFALGGLDHGPVFSPDRRERAWNDFLYRAGAYMDLMNWKVTSTHHFEDKDDTLIGDEVWTRYAAGLPGCWGIFNGYNAVAGLYGENTRTTDGMPVFHTVLDRNSGDPGSLQTDIAAAAGATRPAFVMVFWVPFGLDMNWGISELQGLSSEYKVVLPSEFAAFYRQANGLPDPPGWPIWVSPTPTPTLSATIPTPTPKPTSTPTPPNYPIPLMNPGFEFGSLIGWTRFYNDQRVYVTRAEFSIDPYEGRYMFGATHSFDSEGTRELIYQTVNVNPGDPLILSAYIRTRTVGGPEQDNYVRLAYDPLGGTNFQYSEPYYGNVWRQQSIAFTAAASQVTVGAELNQVYYWDWNHYFVDLFSLVRGVLQNTPTPTMTPTHTPIDTPTSPPAARPHLHTY
jgi:hypothetical protein